MNKEDFTFLRNNPNDHYFDSSCVSLKPDSVLNAIKEYYEEYPSCGGDRSTHKLAQKTGHAVHQARNNVKKFFSAKKEEEIIFTRNTTESINLIAHSFPFTSKTILTSDKEHNSNYVPWLKRTKKGFTHLRAPTQEGVIDVEAFTQLLEDNDVDLVAINHISNCDGVVNPVKQLTKIAHKHNAKVLVDGAQSAGHMPVDVRDLDADFFACSGHKMLGPSGTGILYGKKDELEKLDTFLVGGDTVDDVKPDEITWSQLPERFEAGLQNYAGMAGLGAACSYLDKIGLKKIEKNCNSIREEIEALFADVDHEVLGAGQKSSIFSFIPKNMKSHELALLLANKNIATRSGTFCCHSWFHKYNKQAAIRFSTHVYNDENDVEALKDAMREFRKLM